MLYAEIARSTFPTPAANYVRVVINGEYWGVYINAQQFNADFTRDFFASTKGARWKVPGVPRGRGGLEYLRRQRGRLSEIYQIKTKDDAESWQALIETLSTC